MTVAFSNSPEAVLRRNRLVLQWKPLIFKVYKDLQRRGLLHGMGSDEALSHGAWALLRCAELNRQRTGSLYSYLYQSIEGHLLDAHKAWRPWLLAFSDLQKSGSQEEGWTPEEIVFREDDPRAEEAAPHADRAEELLRLLPEKERAAVRAIVLGEASGAEYASAIGVDPGTPNRWVRRGLDRLREYLTGQDAARELERQRRLHADAEALLATLGRLDPTGQGVVTGRLLKLTGLTAGHFHRAAGFLCANGAVEMVPVLVVTGQNKRRTWPGFRRPATIDSPFKGTTPMSLADRTDLDPLKPTPFPPCSEERIEVYRRRAELRLPLFMKGDAADLSPRLGFLAEMMGTGGGQVAVVTEIVEERLQGLRVLQKKPARVKQKQSPSHLVRNPEKRRKEAQRKREARALKRSARAENAAVAVGSAGR